MSGYSRRSRLEVPCPVRSCDHPPYVRLCYLLVHIQERHPEYFQARAAAQHAAQRAAAERAAAGTALPIHYLAELTPFSRGRWANESLSNHRWSSSSLGSISPTAIPSQRTKMLKSLRTTRTGPEPAAPASFPPIGPPPPDATPAARQRHNGRPAQVDFEIGESKADSEYSNSNAANSAVLPRKPKPKRPFHAADYRAIAGPCQQPRADICVAKSAPVASTSPLLHVPAPSTPHGKARIGRKRNSGIADEEHEDDSPLGPAAKKRQKRLVEPDSQPVAGPPGVATRPTDSPEEHGILSASKSSSSGRLPTPQPPTAALDRVILSRSEVAIDRLQEEYGNKFSNHAMVRLIEILTDDGNAGAFLAIKAGTVRDLWLDTQRRKHPASDL